MFLCRSSDLKLNLKVHERGSIRNFESLEITKQTKKLMWYPICKNARCFQVYLEDKIGPQSDQLIMTLLSFRLFQLSYLLTSKELI